NHFKFIIMENEDVNHIIHETAQRTTRKIVEMYGFKVPNEKLVAAEMLLTHMAEDYVNFTRVAAFIKEMSIDQTLEYSHTYIKTRAACYMAILFSEDFKQKKGDTDLLGLIIECVTENAGIIEDFER